MPDDNQIPNSNPPTGAPIVPPDQGQTQPVVQSKPQVTASAPVGKETVPMSILQPQQEWVAETAPIAKIEEELQEAEVTAPKGEVLQVAPDVAQAGVVPVGTAAPIPTDPSIQFPMTEEKAKGILKMHKKVKESITWLAMLIIRQMKMISFQQKKSAKGGSASGGEVVA